MLAPYHGWKIDILQRHVSFISNLTRDSTPERGYIADTTRNIAS